MSWTSLSWFCAPGLDAEVEYVRTDQVVPGVICHVYRLPRDSSRDLGIIEISPDCATPMQRVAEGDETVEGWLAGAGTLTVIMAGVTDEHAYPGAEPGTVTVELGGYMMWQAGPAGLVAYEICTPPYAPGRFAGLFRQHL